MTRTIRRLLIAASVAVAPAPIAVAQEAPSATRPALAQRPGDPTGDDSAPDELFAGVWRNVADPDHWLVLEPGRVRELRAGHAEFARAEYDLDTFVRSSWGRRTHVVFGIGGTAADEVAGTLDDEVITTTTGVPPRGATTVCWKRAAPGVPLPAALDPQPLPLGARAEIPAERLAELHAEFARRHELDQAVRKSKASKPMHDELEAMSRVDADNTAWLRARVGELGWIDVERFGKEAALSAVLIVQHSGDLPLMLAALPEIERDVREHGLDGQNFALLWDRTQVTLGRRQRYGSQLGGDELGRLVVVALEDCARVEELRKALRMQPLKQYLDFFRTGTPPRQVAFEDDEAG